MSPRQPIVRKCVDDERVPAINGYGADNKVFVAKEQRSHPSVSKRSTVIPNSDPIQQVFGPGRRDELR